MDKELKGNGNVANCAQQGYECKVGLEALGRAGRNPNLKGVVHEVLLKDKVNAQNLFNGKTAALTRSTTAVRDDVIVKAAGKVVERFQLKDAPASVGKVIKQASSGKYAGTKLIGTTETVEKYVSSGGNGVKTMTSSGISTKTTEGLANKTLGNLGSANNLVNMASKAGIIGGAWGGVTEAVCSLEDLADGKIDGAEYAGRIVKSGVKSAAASAGGAAVATATSAIASTAISSSVATATLTTTALGASLVAAAPLVVGTVAAIAVGSVICSVFDSIFD